MNKPQPWMLKDILQSLHLKTVRLKHSAELEHKTLNIDITAEFHYQPPESSFTCSVGGASFHHGDIEGVMFPACDDSPPEIVLSPHSCE